MSAKENGSNILDDWTHWVEILINDDLKCVYRGLDGRKDLHSFWQIVNSLDHLIPRSAGGLDTSDNLVTCCWPCNKRKSDYDPRWGPDGVFDETASRVQMIKNVKARWQKDREYWEEARKEFVKRLAMIPKVPKDLIASLDAALSRE